MDTGNFKEVFTSDETKQLRAELAAANARIADLETELQRAYETVDDNWVQHQQLAALQALLQNKDEALAGMLLFAGRNICSHEETHRGGAIWEICDMCGAKWADDEGGKPAFEYPKEYLAALDALSITSPTDALAPYLRCVEALEWHAENGKCGLKYQYCDCPLCKALAAVKGEKHVPDRIRAI